MKIAWTAPALRDLTAARAHIAQDDPGAAKRQVQLILNAVAKLPEFPDAARPGRHPGTRELVVPNTPFLVPYRVRGDVIDVLRVLHGRQSWPEVL